MRVLIIHGNKLDPKGQISERFKRRIDTGLNYAKQNFLDAIVISGGKTCGAIETEAEAGRKYLADKTTIKLVKEEHSRTTAENIIFCKRMRGLQGAELVVVTDVVHLARVMFLYHKLWPEIQKIKFIKAPCRASDLEWLKEFFYLFMAFINPQEKYLESFKEKRQRG